MEAVTLDNHQNYIVRPEMLKILQKPLVYHSIFWSLYFAFNVARWGSYFEDYFYSLQSNLVTFPISMLLAYLNVYVLLPRFLMQKKLLHYFVFLLIAIFGMIYIREYLHFYLVSEVVWRESSRQVIMFSPNHLIQVALGELYIIGLTTAIKLTIERIRNDKRRRELEKQNYETELAFLKSQIQPHFFFNTLNNLYSLTLIKSDEAPDVVIKLSELMRYVIYEAGNKRVPLETEITHIHNYMDLERLRFGKRLQINTNISGNLGQCQVPPLLLLPFIENTFKHGVGTHAKTTEININLEIREKFLYFRVSNPIAQTPISSTLPVKGGGVGLKNTQRRLDLIYKGNYKLNIKKNHTTYEVTLKIPTT